MNWPAVLGVLAGAAGVVTFVLFIINPLLEEPKKRRMMIVAFGIGVVCAALAAGLS
ncbi:hypothetical protein SEA_TYKE_14 [Mycobacterium phage Tyke]|uniref:Uncharacterized protein n=4 Tax=Bixzunavirus Bxz1 TaxID=2006134 RepID=Q853R3_BPMBZ|nr:gp14 [Mycobacterium phage Bxz1]YP_002224269.1 gp15 [Mycobacterium phage Spud]YP_009017350.1 hypothetical protein MOMOMIXON_14 [Mycobacterium phage MoMoMixon]AER49530.1 hypothetical protein PIO_15 [Mycobacterium phage Pio]AVR77752.1 hypothetical protein SEA_TYKE_14 [Mycobacterium phage Tyke]QAX93772.1 hypothetical protein SEA_SHELOB_12 [Mycobacterium phage Shelob]AAN16674.1 hypothetical protein PBI_BXZ1_14 [Mycobacterium phage Bxz1]ACH62472.1 hypothetical protein SPUD_15 [Mycobacterium pha